MPLHPAEHRGYRELFIAAQQAQTRLQRLAGHLEGEPAASVGNAHVALRELLDELEPVLARHNLYAEHAARGNGVRIGLARAAVLDRFLERNQAMRFAVDDLEHVTTLLAYLRGVAAGRGDTELTELCRRSERSMRRHVRAVRNAVVELGLSPDEAIEPVDRSAIGKAAYAVAFVVGTAGEAFDRLFHRR